MGGPRQISVSQLPSGDPLQKGRSLDPAIPGYKTFAKPVNDIREPRQDDETIFRVENADDLLKNRSRVDINEDNATFHDGIGYRGEGPWDSSSKTKYPYRDGIPNQHNASIVRIRTASKISEILEDTGFSNTCSVSLIKKSRGILVFLVDCGGEARKVKVKPLGEEGPLFSNVDLLVTCSCPAWQWQGPEYHAKNEGYLLGAPRGTASKPTKKVTQKVCKHTFAVLSKIKNWKLNQKG
jgi:hypothetical protein